MPKEKRCGDYFSCLAVLFPQSSHSLPLAVFTIDPPHLSQYPGKTTIATGIFTHLSV